MKNLFNFKFNILILFVALIISTFSLSALSRSVNDSIISPVLTQSDIEANIFYHPATEDKAWLYDGDASYVSTGLNGGSGLRAYKKIYRGDEVDVSFTLSEPFTEGRLFAIVDRQRVYMVKGETYFSHKFTVTSESTSNLRVGVDTFPQAEIRLTDIKFLLNKAEQPKVNLPPTAKAGDDLVASSGDIVVLDGGGSKDSEGDLTYKWKLLDNLNETILLEGEDTEQPQFKVPEINKGENLSFELTVIDSHGLSDIDVVTVVILPENTEELPYESIYNHPATEDKAWIYNGNDSYVSTGLNGGSGLRSYSKVNKGDQVLVSFELNQAFSSGRLFSIVDKKRVYMEKGEKNFSYLYTVTSSTSSNLRVGVDVFPEAGIVLSNIKFLLIPSQNEKKPNAEPTANAGIDQSVISGELVNLDGSLSHDDSENLMFHWVQKDNSGIDIELNDSNSISPNFIAPEIVSEKMISFELTVTDEGGLSDHSIVEVVTLPDLYHRFKPSYDSNIIYVSSQGNDETGRVNSVDTVFNAINPNVDIYPFKTLKAAMSKVRDGYPDWVLLKRGEEWENENLGTFNKSGRSKSERILIGYYGEEGERPLIKTGTSYGFSANNKLTSNIVIVGLDFYSHTRDPNSSDYSVSEEGTTGISFIGGGENILIEDTVVRYFKSGIVVQSFDNKAYKNFELKRSIITDSYSKTSHSQGMYISGVDGILIEKNVFDHNGWHETIAPASAYSHNIYMQTTNVGKNIIVKENVIARASSHGVHGRAGGLFENNTFIENSISLQLGYITTPLAEGTIASARGNVIISGKLMDPSGVHESTTTAIWGLFTEKNAIDKGGLVLVENNIIANAKNFQGNSRDLEVIPGGIYTNNITYNWDSKEENLDPTWKNPDIGINDFMESIGESPSLEAYLNQLRLRKLNRWNNTFSSLNVNEYIRGGFSK